jgi:L-cysteine:1D-myo-inositol 2-amino-2-deoxy-alpha-D-glucopyranoside ligase
MSRKFLGDQVDIHGGGGDLVFPHHECEIAQAESATGKEPFVRIWMHAAMVRKDGEKMSKSLGNLVWARELLESYAPDAVRLYLAAHHYRTSFEWDAEDFERYAEMAERWLLAARTPSTGNRTMNLAGYRQALVRAMDEDLGTFQASGILDELVTRLLPGSLRERDQQEGQRILRECAGWLGMRLDQPGVEQRVTDEWNKHLQRFIVKSSK